MKRLYEDITPKTCSHRRDVVGTNLSFCLTYISSALIGVDRSLVSTKKLYFELFSFLILIFFFRSYSPPLIFPKSYQIKNPWAKEKNVFFFLIENSDIIVWEIVLVFARS